jgi:hypothetical protein
MGRRVIALTQDHFEVARGECGECTRLILAPMDAELLDRTERRAARGEWLREVLDDWGTCGQVLLNGTREEPVPVGLVTYAPASYLPGLASLATAPPSRDAVVMVDLVLEPGIAAAAGARMLVQHMARDLVLRQVVAIEAFADGSRSAARGAQGCAHPVGLLTQLGFTVHRDHPRTPRMRMDLRTALTWRDEVENAIERVMGAVRPPKPTEATRR